MIEKWMRIVGYEDYYQISNQGNIKSMDQKVRYTHAVTKDEFFRNKKSRIMKQVTNSKNGYNYVTLRMPNINPKTYSIHRLVAEAFKSNKDNLPCVNHIDGDKVNNNSNNLEWCTHKQNSRHASKNNLMIKGDKHYKSILSDAQVIDIRKSKDTIVNLAKRYNVEYRSMWQIVRGITR